MDRPPQSEPLVRVLVASTDLKAILTIQQSLAALGVTTEVIGDGDRARKRVGTAKLEGIIIDSEQRGWAQLIHAMRSAPSNRNCVSFVLLADFDAPRTAEELGVTFVLRKPIGEGDGAIRIFRSAFSLLLRERRRYFRAAAEFPVQVIDSSRQSWCKALNISEGGLALEGLPRMPLGGVSELRWRLPNHTDEFSAESEVVWNSERRCGFQFTKMSADQRWELQKWLMIALARVTDPRAIKSNRPSAIK